MPLGAERQRWNHNIQYHPLLLGALPPSCDHALDVGCGEGILAAELSSRSQRVTAIDVDASTIALAQQDGHAHNIDYLLADFLTYPFEPASFDAIVSVAAVHHMGTAAALERMRALVRPAGTIAIVGLGRSGTATDLAYDIAGAVVTRVHQLTKPYWESSAPTIWPPAETFSEVRRAARRILPGARYRRHALWRYSLVWSKPRPTYGASE